MPDTKLELAVLDAFDHARRAGDREAALALALVLERLRRPDRAAGAALHRESADAMSSDA